MERIRGKKSLSINSFELQTQMTPYPHCLIDIGTGDGRFIQNTARQQPEWFCIGIDACRENLHKTSQKAPANALYLIASAQALPAALNGRASRITINFPWGSLLESLLQGDPALLDGLERLALSNTRIEIRLNGGALAEAGWSLETGARQVYENLCQAGWKARPPVALGDQDLRAFPSTWARRLAFGRDPRAVLLSGQHLPLPKTKIRDLFEYAI